MGVFGVPMGVFWVSERPPNAIDPHLWGLWGHLRGLGVIQEDFRVNQEDFGVT